VRHYVLALYFAIAGGMLGIVGAFVEELRSGGSALLIIFSAPVIEEVLKPAGIYLFLVRWPHALRNQLQLASLTAVSGLTFGLVESAVYVTLYFPDESQGFFVYRFTVTVALHAVASFIAGLGVNPGLVDWAAGRTPFPRTTLVAFGVAIALHAAYNTTALALGLSGVLDFD
jgi:RsiW-degrading membrane proteinase PrsW (M82 family)